VNPLLPPARLDFSALVRGDRSSFAPAFRLLPAGRRKDLETLYAFCRTIDDIADAGGYPAGLRHEALAAWRAGFRDAELRGLPENLVGLVRRRALDRLLFRDLLDGVETDLAPAVRMATRGDLDLYCHRVAGTVGLLCLPVFGADPVRAKPYAETLGRALQYTNILRDTAADWQRGRIYYPLDELEGAGVGDFPRGAQAYLAFFAGQTEELFEQARALIPPEDRRALRPARVMSSVYRALLRKMRRGGRFLNVPPCRLSAPEKLFAVIRSFAQ
jgi:phytoene synthase